MKIARNNRAKGYLTKRNFADIKDERTINQLSQFYETDARFMEKATLHLGECLSCLASIKAGKFTEYDDSVEDIDKIYYQLLNIARKLDAYERAFDHFVDRKIAGERNNNLDLKDLVEKLIDDLTPIDPNKDR